MICRATLLLTSAVLLQGCTSLHVMSHIPLSTMSRLSSLKLAEIEPAALRVAARMPDRIEPRKLGVKARITVASFGGTPVNEEFILEPAAEPDEVSALAMHRRNGTRLWAYRLSVADAARLQQITASRTGASDEARVTIAAGVDACRRGPLGSEPLATTTYLRTNATGYFILAEDLDLRVIVPAHELAAKVPPCA